MDTYTTATTKPSANIKLRCFIVLVNKDLEKFDWAVSLGKREAVTINLIIKILIILNLRDLTAYKQITQRILD